MSPVPPCYRGSQCSDHDRLPQWENRHIPGCALSATGRTLRARRIDALAPRQMRTALHVLSGIAPTGTDLALDDADEAARCRECREDAPWHTAQCTLKPGAPPVAVPVMVQEVAR